MTYHYDRLNACPGGYSIGQNTIKANRNYIAFDECL
jgi:hypothetical protein